jgi:hypothetical protein
MQFRWTLNGFDATSFPMPKVIQHKSPAKRLRRRAPASSTLDKPSHAAVGAGIKGLCDTYGLKRDTLTRLSGFSQRGVANWASGKKPSEATAKRWTETERLLDGLADVIEPERIGAWLKTPNPAFDGSTPLQVIERGESDRIWLMIYEFASGQPG